MASELRTWFLTATFVVLAAGGAGCGDFVESNDDVKRLTVGAEGGTLAIETFALVVPPQALNHTVTLSARRGATDAPAGPAFTVESADHVTFPSIAAQVTLHYDATIHTSPADVFAATYVSGVWHQLTRPAGDLLAPGVANGVTMDVGTFGLVDCPGGVCP